MGPEINPIPVDAIFFEDIIDGYFPLQESLRQMLCRNGFASACITLTYVPIMDIPGLAADAPVPLRLAKGTAGIADRLDIIVALDGAEPQVSGTGTWRWYSEGKAQETLLSPLTRLTEPAIVQGVGLIAGSTQTQCFGQISVRKNSDFVIYRDQGPDLRSLPNAVLWAKSPLSNEIHDGANLRQNGLFETPAFEFENDAKPSCTSTFPRPTFTEILALKDSTRLTRS